MPFSTNPPTSAYDPSDDLPEHLAHKPVFALPYQHFDAPFSPNTDARYISVGNAQYGHDYASVKLMRHTGEKWTRQAEELPPHRVVDMAIFLAKTFFDADTGTVTFEPGTFNNQAAEITLSPEPRSYGERASYQAFKEEHNPALIERFSALRQVLNDLHARGKI